MSITQIVPKVLVFYKTIILCVPYAWHVDNSYCALSTCEGKIMFLCGHKEYTECGFYFQTGWLFKCYLKMDKSHLPHLKLVSGENCSGDKFLKSVFDSFSSIISLVFSQS